MKLLDDGIVVPQNPSGGTVVDNTTDDILELESGELVELTTGQAESPGVQTCHSPGQFFGGLGTAAGITGLKRVLDMDLPARDRQGPELFSCNPSSRRAEVPFQGVASKEGYED